MKEKNMQVAKGYYTSLGNKNIKEMEKYLHPDIKWKSPLGDMEGKEAVLASAEQFIKFFNTLNIRTQFGAGDQVMMALDLECPEPTGSFQTAALLTIKDDLITKIELFYDGRPFEAHQEEILS